MAMSKWTRSHVGWIVVALALVAGISTQLAVSSGQTLEDNVSRSAALRQHVQIAESIRPLILALFVVAAVIMVMESRASGSWPFRDRTSPTAPIGLAARIGIVLIAAAVSVGTNIRLVQIGDSGARATWSRVQIRTGQGDSATPGR